jgi:fatty acid desaturase
MERSMSDRVDEIAAPAERVRAEDVPQGSQNVLMKGARGRPIVGSVTNRGRYPIPVVFNLALSALQICGVLALLTICSRATSLSVVLVSLLSFTLVAQLGFCLTHESIHGKFHPDARWNDVAGTALMAFFPGSYHFLRVAHLTHHRRNRTDAELEDYVLPGESAFWKRLQYYALICGLFWLLIPLSSIALALIPRRRLVIRSDRSDAPMWLRFAEFLNDIDLNRLRIDVAFSALVWFVAATTLHLRPAAVAGCYIAFAFSWASQQYIYHVRTPLDVVEGALDLRLWRPMEMLYLNFNYHLTHHRAVSVPWIHLRGIVAERPTRTYLRTYLELWQPPQRLVRDTPSSRSVMPRSEPTEIRPATDADNEALLALTRATPMPGTTTLRIDRDPDFFRLVQMRGPATVFVATRGGRAIGCISASRRRQYVRGEIRDVTYLGDLKIDPSCSGGRVAIQLLSATAGALRTSDADLLVTVIADGNARAIGLLDRRLGFPRWESLGAFAVSELLPSPLARRNSCTIRHATDSDAVEISRLANEFHRLREFAPVVAPEDVRPAKGAIPIVAVRGDEIVATLTMFDANEAKQNVVVDTSMPLRLSLRLLQSSELLLKSFRAPRVGVPIHLVYLRWLAHKPQHADALRALVQYARHEAYRSRYSFVVTGIHERDSLQQVVSGLPRMTFRSQAFAVSLDGRTDVEPIVRGIPFQDYALV